MSDTELQLLFQEWWKQSYPHSPPGQHALATHIGWGRFLLEQMGEQQPLCGGTGERLRAARRPNPPSLKQQALAELTAWTEMRNGPGESLLCDGLSVATIRRALEALPDD